MSNNSVAVNQTFVQNLRRIVKSQRWRQVDIAAALGVSPVTVNRWLAGSRRVSPRYVDDLLKLLGVTPEEMASRDEMEISSEDWMRRALRAEARLARLRCVCKAMRRHVQAMEKAVAAFARATAEDFANAEDEENAEAEEDIEGVVAKVMKAEAEKAAQAEPPVKVADTAAAVKAAGAVSLEDLVAKVLRAAEAAKAKNASLDS